MKKVVCLTALIVLVLGSSFGMAQTKNILVAYSSFAGSTKEVARFMEEQLSAQDVAVRVENVNDVKDLSGFDGCILGSAIRFGSLHSSMKDFLSRNKTRLDAMPVAAFAVCGRPENGETYTEQFTGVIKPIRTAVFEGKIDYKKLGFLDSLICKVLGAPEEDKRDWEEIRAWTLEAVAAMEPRHPGPGTMKD